jgi:hypothetical protein
VNDICHAEGSKLVVEQACLERNNCTLDASSDAFGYPAASAQTDTASSKIVETRCREWAIGASAGDIWKDGCDPVSSSTRACTGTGEDGRSCPPEYTADRPCPPGCTTVPPSCSDCLSAIKDDTAFWCSTKYLAVEVLCVAPGATQSCRGSSGASLLENTIGSALPLPADHPHCSIAT